MLESDKLLNLLMKICMLTISASENFKEFSTPNFNSNRAYNRLEEAQLVVLDGHPHHSLPFALHSSRN